MFFIDGEECHHPFMILGQKIISMQHGVFLVENIRSLSWSIFRQ